MRVQYDRHTDGRRGKRLTGRSVPVATCGRCRARLASDNAGGLCSPCSRVDRAAVRIPPASFWVSEPVQRAVARRDFGLIIKAARAAGDPPVRQAEMGVWLGLSQAQVSRIESGRSPVNDLVKLTRWAHVLGAPADVLWFRLAPPLVPAVPAAAASEGMPTLPSAPAVVAVGPSRLIGRDEVDVVRETTRAFRQIDNRFGGGRARSAVSAYLGTEIEDALSGGRFARGARPVFERAAAELFQLAGWMSYDVGDAREGRSQLRKALDLATAAGDEALTAEMLAGMSHQAAFLRRTDETIDLALAARRAAHRSGSPALQAESAVLEAQGLALMSDARGAVAALARADKLFAKAVPENTPQFLGYFDRAYLSARFAQVLRDVGRSADAERFARDSLLMSDGYERGRMFNTALLASILADSGSVEESVSVARDAVRMAGRVRSARAQGYLRDVATRLAPYRTHADVASLLRDMVSAGVNVRP